MCRRFTEEQKKFLKKYNYLNLKELTRKFNLEFNENRSYDTIRTITRIYSLREIRNGDFKKGHVPWNKGKKGLQVRNRTSFLKNGYITIYLDRNKENKQKNNLYKLSLKEFAQVNKVYKLKENEPELNKSKILTIQLKYKTKVKHKNN